MVVYEFNPLTPLDLLAIPENSSLIHKERVSREEIIKKFHEKVKTQIEKKIKNMLKATIKEERK